MVEPGVTVYLELARELEGLPLLEAHTRMAASAMELLPRGVRS